MNDYGGFKMREQAIQKINGMGKVGGILILIAKILFGIALALSMIGTIVMICIPRDFIRLQGSTSGTVIINMDAVGRELTDEERDNINNGKTFDGDTFTYELNANQLTLDQFSAEGNTIQISSTGTLTDSVSLRDFGYVLVTAVITIAMTLVSLFFAGFLCKAFKECQSPFEETVIKKMRGFAYSLIPWVILNSISESMTDSLLNGKLNVQVSLDITMLIIVLIILALVYIFQYGAMLQQESDETL